MIKLINYFLVNGEFITSGNDIITKYLIEKKGNP